MIKASLSYGNYRLWRRLAYGHAKGEREKTMSNWRGFLRRPNLRQLSLYGW
ncbi:hypothetical protein [Moorena producens]|uniref:hypothetical protein n=1 Tax=Moorena producens TaxID=1155739 RepID=UPI003C720F21